MKNYLPVVFLMMLLLGCSVKPAENYKADAEATITGFNSALEKFDYEQLRTFCAPDFSGCEDGIILNNIDDFIAVVKSFELTSGNIKIDFVKTDATKEMAYSSLKFDGQFKGAKAETNIKTFENYIVKNVNGRWLICFYHSSYLKDPQKPLSGNVPAL